MEGVGGLVDGFEGGRLKNFTHPSSRADRARSRQITPDHLELLKRQVGDDLGVAAAVVAVGVVGEQRLLDDPGGLLVGFDQLVGWSAERRGWRQNGGISLAGKMAVQPHL